MEVRGLNLSLASAWSAGALSMRIDMLVDRRMGVVVVTRPSIRACFVSVGMSVDVT